MNVFGVSLVTILVAVIALAALILLVKVLRGRNDKDVARGPDWDVKRLLTKGRYEEAAKIALDRGQFDQAIDYYIRAQKPARAAHAAAQAGHAQQAAELFERAGLNDQAARHYEIAGLTERARELRPIVEKPAAPRAADLHTQAANAMVKMERPDPEALRKAEALLAAGDLRNAAIAYHQGRHYEEALHLYVNVLGMPGEAAPILVQAGRHDRAAELYELAGDTDRAAELWTMVAKSTGRPEQFAERIRALSPARAVTFFEELVLTRPMSKQTAELHYQLGLSLAAAGDSARALQHFITLHRTVGEYRETSAHVLSLQMTPQVHAAAGCGIKREQPEPRPRILEAPLEGPPPSPAASRSDSRRLAPELLQAEVEALVREASEQAFPPLGRVLEELPVEDTFVRHASAASNELLGKVGLENAPPPPILFDSAVQAARVGPSPETLARLINGEPCDLRNIEAYYRLGLVRLARGEWDAAMAAFRAVEEASPGYRDAVRRASIISEWQGKMASHLTMTQIRGGTAAKKKTDKSRYTIAGELGRGGMAVVYRAVDEVLGREVALKFLSDEFLARSEARDLFLREARSVAQLNHPNVVTIYDFGLLESRTFIAMEYVEGVTLRDLPHAKRIAVVDCLRLVNQLLDALEYAHGRSIIHRDIKPSNIMRTTAGMVKLMDFGLAKSIAKNPEQSMIAGTPAYMSPEQMLGEELDCRSDLFSVGVTFYELLTGALPFKKSSRTPPESTLKYNPSIPRVVDEIVLRSIALPVEQRFQSAAAFKVPIHRLLQEFSARATGEVGSVDVPRVEVLKADVPRVEILKADAARVEVISDKLASLISARDLRASEEEHAPAGARLTTTRVESASLGQAKGRPGRSG